MPYIKKSPFAQAIIKSILGSTEGTYYEDSNGNIVDLRTKPITSIGNSGLSFGLTQLDVANNIEAETLFNSLLQDAYNNGRITLSEKNDFAARAATPGIGSSPNDFTQLEETKIQTQVLNPNKELIYEKDQEIIDEVVERIDDLIGAIVTEWGTAGVFDPENADFYKAIGHAASWTNRTGPFTSMLDYLTGESVSGLDTLTHAPTYDDLEYYLENQQQFEDHPGEFDNVTGNIVRGENILPGLVGPSEMYGPPESYGPYVLPTFVPEAYGPFQQAPSLASPLVIDLDGDGIELTTFNAASTATFFDIEGDGFAEQTAWITANQDGLLARDVNENGTIDDVAELFGSPNVDGFALLAQLDSNHDMLIDLYDDAWDELLVWKDVNGDAISQSGELTSLAAAGIANIKLDTVTSSTSTINGNPISHTASFTKSNGTTGNIADAWFVHSNINSYYNEDYALDVRTLFLPTLRGFGKIADLHIAMSMDEDLLDLVHAFATTFTVMDFADNEALDETIADILYKWAGVDGINPTSRGSYIDARSLGFIEHFFDKDFISTAGSQTGNTNPFSNAARRLNNSYDIVFENLKAMLVLQVGGQLIFGNDATYNPWTSEIEGTLAINQVTIQNLGINAPTAGATNDAYWIGIAGFIDTVKGLTNLTTNENNWMNAAILDSDPNLDWSDVKIMWANEEAIVTTNGTSGADTITGHAGADVINGNNGNDTIYGLAGDDTLNGGSGDDHLYGGDGNDELSGGLNNNILEGGAGGNTLIGFSGNDTYIYGWGDDYISESGGTDQLLLPSGIDINDLTFLRISHASSTVTFTDLLILIEGGGSIQLESLFSNTVSNRVETLVFSDTSTLNLTTLAGYETILTDGNDDYNLNLSSNDVVFGNAGNDDIDTGSGNDIIDGGSGNDTLYDSSGNDTYIASPGFDRIWDQAGTDVIIIPDEINPADVNYYRVTNGSNYIDLRLFLPGLGEILLANFFSGTNAIETLNFLYDSSTVTLTNQMIETRGGTGNDSLTGITLNASINDVFNGMEGNDTLTGGTGDDTFIFSQGNDYISDASGIGTIEVRAGYLPSDITLVRSKNGSHYDLKLTDSDSNTITVQQHFSGTPLEYVHFKNGTTWTLASMDVTTHGTASADTLVGADTGDASTADVIYGFAGNDNIQGQLGNDLLYGGDGLDTLYGNAGADTFVFETASAFNNIDLVKDLSTAAGDKINIADLLVGYDPLTEAITDFVTFTNSGSHSKMYVDRDGTSSVYASQQIALVENILSINAETWETNGTLITV